MPIREEIDVAAFSRKHITTCADKVGLTIVAQFKSHIYRRFAAFFVKHECVGRFGQSIGTLDKVASIVGADAVRIGACGITVVHHAAFIESNQCAGGVIVGVEHAIDYARLLCALVGRFVGIETRRKVVGKIVERAAEDVGSVALHFKRLKHRLHIVPVDVG